MAGPQVLNILSWNIRGLSDPHRKVIIRNWIKKLHQKVDILMLQELKADDFRLEIALAYILPSYQVVLSYPNDGCGGTTLLIHPNLVIQRSEVTQQGAAWAVITHVQEEYMLVSIYAPNTATEQKKLWHALADTISNAN
jgi:exonuclease III